MSTRSSTKQPNILLVLTDQQRHDTVAALGNPLIKTPALDRLASEGTAFTRCFTPSPVCVSARCALVTGQPPHVTGCTDNGTAPKETPSLMERLSERGYQTHGVGKMHFAPRSKLWGFESRDMSEEGGDIDHFREFLDENGFSHVEDPHGVRSEYYYIPQPSQLPANLHNTRWTVDRSIDFLQRRDQNRPFFLWTSFIKPHPPFESPTPWNRLYRAAEMPPPFRPEGFEHLLTYWNHHQNRYKYRDHGYDELLARTMKAAYYACVSFIDFQLGRLLKSLEASGDLDNTLILFTSDHGEFLGDYGSYGKRSMLDVAARIPMLARWPQHFPAGERCAAPTTLLDILPTCLAAAGEANPRVNNDGCDLREVLNGDERATVYSQIGANGNGLYMAAGERWKYIYSEPDQQEWLLDAQTDADETRNLAGNRLFAPELDEMRSQLITKFRGDGYTEPLDSDGWKKYPLKTVPKNPDAGLLFQDPPGAQERIDALGPEYSRQVTVRKAGQNRAGKT